MNGIALSGFEPARDRQWWDQQPNETDLAFTVFGQYLDAGPTRTVRATEEDQNKPEGYRRSAQKWSVQYGWRMRADAYDRHLRTIQHDAAKREAERKGEAMGRVADGLWILGGQALQAWAAKMAEHTKLVEEAIKDKTAIPDPIITPLDTVRFVNIGIQLHRVMSGDQDDVDDEPTQASTNERRKKLQQLMLDASGRDAVQTIGRILTVVDGGKLDE